jgi:hypothetical protein
MNTTPPTLSEAIRALTAALEAQGETLVKAGTSDTEQTFYGRYGRLSGKSGRIYEDESGVHCEGELFDGFNVGETVTALRERLVQEDAEREAQIPLMDRVPTKGNKTTGGK